MLRSTLVLLSFLACYGCQPANGANDESPGESEESSEVNEPETEGSSDEAVAQNDGIATDRYPLVLLELLEPDERERLVNLAQAELCPCDGAVASLDDCLSAEETSCELALQGVSIMARMIKEDADDIEISAELNAYLENIRAVHEFDLENTPWKGAEEPEIVIVEFADFQCPHCAHVAGVVSELAEEYGDRVRFYYKHFPLQTHPAAGVAALFADAAHDQGRFWEMHDVIFERQGELNQSQDPVALLMGWAEELGLNLEAVEAYVTNPESLRAIEASRDEGIEAGLNATPTVYIDGVMLLAPPSEEILREELDSRLAE